MLGTPGTRNRWCLVPQEPGTSDARYPRNQEPVGMSGARYPRNGWCSEPLEPVVLGTPGTRNLWCSVPRNQEPVVLGTPGTRNQWCLVPQEPGNSGARYPRNQEPVVLGTPGTGGARYPRNQEPVVLSTPGTGGARYPRTMNQWCSVPRNQEPRDSVPQEPETGGAWYSRN